MQNLPLNYPLDLDLARALRRLYDFGASRQPVDARLPVSTMRRLVQAGLAESIDPPKLIITAAGLAAMPAALALLAAAPGQTR